MKRRKLLFAAPIVVLALAVGGTAFASGGGGFGGPRNGGHGYGPGGRAIWAFGRDSAPLGMVESLSGSTLTILDFDGTTVTYNVSDKTLYYLNGEKGSSNSVAQGENVIVFAGKGWGGWSGGTSSTTPTAQIVWLFSPHAFGSIQSVTPNSTGDLIIVQDPEGFWHAIQTDSSTVYYDNGVSSATAPTFTMGEIISALGSVGSDHETLDAVQVNVVTLHSHH
jgi:hypothetical protein